MSNPLSHARVGQESRWNFLTSFGFFLNNSENVPDLSRRISFKSTTPSSPVLNSRWKVYSPRYSAFFK